MPHRIVRNGIALVGAAAILLLGGWLDGQVFPEIQRREASTFDISLISWALPLGYLMVAASVIAVASLAAWARSLLVGVTYAVVGAFFAFLLTITWRLAAEINGVPAVLPRPLAAIVGDISFWGARGPLNALSTTGAGMLLAGLVSIALVVRRRVTSPPGPRQSDITGAPLTAQPGK